VAHYMVKNRLLGTTVIDILFYKSTKFLDELKEHQMLTVVLCHMKLFNGFKVMPILRETSAKIFRGCCFEKLECVNNFWNDRFQTSTVV
jgi:hypothetical protein